MLNLISIEFLTFFAFLLFLLTLFPTHTTLKKWILLAFSLAFFVSVNPQVLGWALLFIAVDYSLNRILFRLPKPKRLSVYALCIIWELSFLLYFKFVQQSRFEVFHSKELFATTLTWVGISFFVFKAITFSTATYLNLFPKLTWVNYCNYLFFFPQLLAGPIAPASQLYPQLEDFKQQQVVPYGKITLLIGLGLIKKLVVADYLAQQLINRVFETPVRYSAIEVLVSIYGYAIQLFSDFSSYSDFAVAMGLLLGFQTPYNFDRPYLAHSLTDFWKRWHITLSQWLFIYLFNPISNRLAKWATKRKELKPKTLGWITYPISIFVTMSLAGLWHGFQVTYLIWGLLMAGFLIIEKMVRLEKWSQKSTFRKWLARVVIFHLICFCWIWFRSESLTTAKLIIQQLIWGQYKDLVIPFLVSYWKVILILVFGYGIHFVFSNKLVEKLGESLNQLGIIGLWVLYAVILSFVLKLRTTNVEPFIYLQF